MRCNYLIAIITILGCSTAAAQDLDPDVPAHVIPKLIPDSPSELTVLAPTIAPEQLDRVVLNRLLLEISRDPERTGEELGVDAHLLNEIQISLANAASFINDNDMANIRAMCHAWDQSAQTHSSETERIALALDAYKQRRQFTRDFIARFYRVVILEIESFLPEQAVLNFNKYMDDRRRRLANAGNVIAGSVVENIQSGAETVRFHCRPD